MIKGIGVDLATIDRIKQAYLRTGDPFLKRVFTAEERAYTRGKKDPFPHLAGIFAAKEAARKAFGDSLKGIGWTEIEVVHASSGRPKLNMHGHAGAKLKELGIKRIHLSITHDKPQAVAIVIFES